MNILIIDDDPEDTEIFNFALTEILPKAILTVDHSCKDVTTLVRSLPVQDFIFLDGHINSFSVLECFKELFIIIDPNLTKVVIHTGSLSPADISEFKRYGALEVIMKAYNLEELKDNLRRILIESTAFQQSPGEIRVQKRQLQ